MSRRWRASKRRADGGRVFRRRHRAPARRARRAAPIFLLANNVLAHVPDINDFVAGLAILLKPRGRLHGRVSASLEPDRTRCSSTRSITSISPICRCLRSSASSRGMGFASSTSRRSPTHGGSLHVLACHDSAKHAVTENVGRIRDKEIAAKLDRPEGYAGFGARVGKVKTRPLGVSRPRPKAPARRSPAMAPRPKAIRS